MSQLTGEKALRPLKTSLLPGPSKPLDLRRRFRSRKLTTKGEARVLHPWIHGCESGSFGLGWRGARCPPHVLHFSIRGRPHPPRNSLFLDIWVPQARSTASGGRSEGAHRLPRSSLLASLRGQGRQGFHTSHSFVSRGGRGRRSERDRAEVGRGEERQRRWRQRGRDKDEKRDTDSETVFPPVGVRTAGQLSRRRVDFSSLP